MSEPNKRPYKMCMFCKHCEFEEGYSYSEQTQQDAYIACRKPKTGQGTAPMTQKDFIEWNMKARECPHFEVVLN